MLNAHILFQKANPTSKFRFVNFQMNANKGMIAPYNRDFESATAKDECVTRLTKLHFSKHIPFIAKSAKKNPII